MNKSLESLITTVEETQQTTIIMILV